jgi:SAM-dependent methyltransferase
MTKAQDPHDTPHWIAAYAAWGEHYDAIEGDRSGYVAFYASWLRDGDCSVLELGCGTGAVLGPILSQWRARNPGMPLRAVGVDASGSMLERARRVDPLAEWRLGDLRDPPVDGPFDLVFCCFNTLQLLPDAASLRQAFAAVAARLSPTGRFVFDLYRPNLAALRTARNDAPQRELLLGGRRVELRETTRYDEADGIYHLDWRLAPVDAPQDTVAATRYRIRQVWPEDIAEAAAQAGLVVEAAFGDLDRSPPGPDARKQVFALRRG